MLPIYNNTINESIWTHQKKPRQTTVNDGFWRSPAVRAPLNDGKRWSMTANGGSYKQKYIVFPWLLNKQSK